MENEVDAVWLRKEESEVKCGDECAGLVIRAKGLRLAKTFHIDTRLGEKIDGRSFGEESQNDRPSIFSPSLDT